MRKLTLSITLLWLLTAVLPALATDDRPVAYIGGKPFTIEDMETRIAALPAQYQAMLTSDEGRRGFLDQVIQEQVLYLAALEAGLENDPIIVRQLEESRVRTLAIGYFEKYYGAYFGYPEDELRAYYDSHLDEFMTDAQVRMRHILYETKDEARAGKARLDAGEVTFSDEAKENSKDVKTKRLGGMVGLVTKDMPLPQLGAVPELQAAIFDLPVGRVSEPIPSAMGWHLVLVEEKIEAMPLDFERVKMRVAESLLVPEAEAVRFYNEHQEEYLDEMEVKLRIIVCAKESAIDAAYEALERGEKFERVVERYSDDELTKPDGGLVGFVKSTSTIPSLGRRVRRVVNYARDELKDGQYSEPIQIEEGWCIALREAHNPARQKSYDEVRSTVRGRLLGEATNRRIENFFNDLRERYNVRVIEENLFAEPKPKETPAELYELAAIAPPPTAVSYYNKILKFYPDSPEAPKAQFMLGFLYSDKLKNYDEAEAAFNAYLERWPSGELAESARYMLEHMREEDIALPEGL